MIHRAITVILLPLCTAWGAVAGGSEPAIEEGEQPAPSVEELIAFRPAEATGDTQLLWLCGLVADNPEALPLLRPMIEEQLHKGADIYLENSEGCNALFYLHSLPDYLQTLQDKGMLAPEPPLQLPKTETDLAAYIKLRVHQARLAPTPGSRSYLVNRYCKPVAKQVKSLLRRYLKSESLRRLPTGALGDSTAFLRLTAPDEAYALIDSLPLWQHGEHFLEEIPDALLTALCEQEWPVSPGRLRQALHKLDTLLPTAEDDMIDCSAAAPMAHLLTMLVQQEGPRAVVDLRKYEKSRDPELVQTCLRLQLKLQGLTPPDETEDQGLSPRLTAIREALLADAALHHGTAEELTAERLRRAIACLKDHDLPQHAALLQDMLNDEGESIVTEDTLPSLRVRYEEMSEKAPRPALLRYLLEHTDLMRPDTPPEKPESETPQS